MKQLSLLAFCRRCGAPCLPPKKHGSMTKRTCTPCQKELQRIRRENHLARNPGYKRAEYERNWHRYQETNGKYAQENPERRRAATRAWRHRNPGVANERRRKRQVIKLDRIDQQIRKWFYDKRVGDQVVDHIQPLAADGEHAPWNMQLLSWAENAGKKDRLPTLREVMRGERRYRLLRRWFEREAAVGASAGAA